MKISTIRIENFRSFRDETITFNDYNCLVGPNGAGKSTVLNALNVFFRNSKTSSTDVVELCEEDFHCKDTSSPIRITVTFKDLSDTARDALKDYVREDVLIVSAIANGRPKRVRPWWFKKALGWQSRNLLPFSKRRRTERSSLNYEQSTPR